MPIRDQNWYNANASRRHPIDDNATGTDDNDVRILDDIIVDCHIRWPDTIGQYAYVGGITVTDKLVTLVFLAADSVSSATTFTPLGSVCIPQPVDRHVHYPIQPSFPGVGGWVVFGDVAELFVGRFSTPAQALLAPTCARPYRALPVPSVKKQGVSATLVDLVKLVAGTDMELVNEVRNIDGENKDVFVLRLLQSVSGVNVLEKYTGPCDGRPESRTCLKEGIEKVGGVSPDCNGNLIIDFCGEFEQGAYSSCGIDSGIIVATSVGIDDICDTRDPLRFPGADLCSPITQIQPTSSSVESSSSSEGTGSSSSSSSSSCAALPINIDFGSDAIDGFTAELGTWALVQPTIPSP